MTTRHALQLLAVAGWAGLSLELVNAHPWAAILAACAAVLWLSQRGR